MRRKPNTDATVATIIAAARQVFLEKGLHGASITEIAKRAGVTKSLIHYHFGSKEALWEAVKQGACNEYIYAQREMLLAREATPELLRESIELYFDFMHDHPEVSRLFTWMAIERDRLDLPDDVSPASLGVQRAREGQQNGSLRKGIPPPMLLIAFKCMVEHWFSHKHQLASVFGLDPNEPGLDAQYKRAMLDIFFHGVLPRDDVPAPSEPSKKRPTAKRSAPAARSKRARTKGTVRRSS